MARVHTMSAILTGKHALPASMWFAFRAGMQYEHRRELMDAARREPANAVTRRMRVRYARRCNWEMLRLLREANAARAHGD